MPWIDRTIRGPDAEYLSYDEFRKLFGVPEEWLDAKIADGTVPKPITLSARTKMFSWEHAIYLSLWLKFNGLPTADKKSSGGEAGKLTG